MNRPRYHLAPSLACGHGMQLWPLLEAFHAGTLAGEAERELAALLEQCPDCDALWAFDTAITELRLLTPATPSLVETITRLHEQFLQGMAGQQVSLELLTARSLATSHGRTPIRLNEVRTHSPQSAITALAFMNTGVIWGLEPALGQIEAFAEGSRVGRPLDVALASADLFALDEAGMCAWVEADYVEARRGSGDGMFQLTSPPFPTPDFRPSALALDTPLIAVGGADGRVLLWQAGEPRWHELVPGAKAPITCLVVRSQQVAWGDAAGMCRVYDLAAGSMAELPLSDQPLTAIALGEGERLAAAIPEALVLLEGEQAATLPGRSVGITALAFHGSEPILAAATTGNGSGKPKLSLYRLLRQES